MSDFGIDDIFSSDSSSNSTYDPASYGLDLWTGDSSTYDFSSDNKDLVNLFSADTGSVDSSTTSDLWGWLKGNESVLSGLSGAVKAGLSYYDSSQTRDQNNSQFNQSLALNQAALADKVLTRAQHNASISAGPQSQPKSIKRLG